MIVPCPTCGADVQHKADLCPRCGTIVPLSVFLDIARDDLDEEDVGGVGLEPT